MVSGGWQAVQIFIKPLTILLFKRTTAKVTLA